MTHPDSVAAAGGPSEAEPSADLYSAIAAVRIAAARDEANGHSAWAKNGRELVSRLEQFAAELPDLLADRRRVDWLDSQRSFSGKWYDEDDGFNSPTVQFSVSFGCCFEADTVRQVIDAARAVVPGGEPAT